MDVRRGKGREEVFKVGYWKIVSVNQVGLFVGLTPECEACRKSLDVSLCANKYKWQQSLTTLKYI
ncbi:hypothetical protein T12_4802 [Trichinella patagoniensis]|uniref:Uncharacterized protein n=1 Tax=Trichinella patagoniensis TaxID=990121 RepID=A0A0V0Z2X3_9BILA|nr:hypothetical protein T12_4802 [Trichinella patagoniensis]